MAKSMAELSELMEQITKDLLLENKSNWNMKNLAESLRDSPGLMKMYDLFIMGKYDTFESFLIACVCQQEKVIGTCTTYLFQGSSSFERVMDALSKSMDNGEAVASAIAIQECYVDLNMASKRLLVYPLLVKPGDQITLYVKRSKPSEDKPGTEKEGGKQGPGDTHQ